jgi:PHP family Zn ribbon phosphoesterase
MKKMTCKQLGGACDIDFWGESFEEIAKQSKKHGLDMFKKGDAAHIDAMNEMQKMMKEPSEFAKWYESKMEEFNILSTIHPFHFLILTYATIAF